jgi:hypothetical protein
VVVVLGAVLLEMDDGEMYIFGLKWPCRCSFQSRFGIKCGFCGMTRSFQAIGKGDLREAVAFHPLGPAIFGYMCLQILYRIYALAIAPRRPNRKMMKLGVALGVLLIAAVFLNWFVYLGGLIV